LGVAITGHVNTPDGDFIGRDPRHDPRIPIGCLSICTHLAYNEVKTEHPKFMTQAFTNLTSILRRPEILAICAVVFMADVQMGIVAVSLK